MGESLLGGGPVRRVATAGGGERQGNGLSTTTQFGKNNSGGVGGVGTGYWGQFCPRRAKAIATSESVKWHAAVSASGGKQ